MCLLFLYRQLLLSLRLMQGVD
ncbi:hypothetical protein LINGRAHAP2_LOCUS23618 [Linum grandiflorum]